MEGALEQHQLQQLIFFALYVPPLPFGGEAEVVVVLFAAQLGLVNPQIAVVHVLVHVYGMESVPCRSILRCRSESVCVRSVLPIVPVDLAQHELLYLWDPIFEADIALVHAVLGLGSEISASSLHLVVL